MSDPNHISLDQIRQLLAEGVPLPAMVTDTLKAYDAMRTRAEAAEATVARLTEALSALRNDVAGSWVFGEAGIREAVGNTNYAIVLRRLEDAEAALSASSTPDPNSKTTIMRAADQSALSGGQDLREVPDTKGSQR